MPTYILDWGIDLILAIQGLTSGLIGLMNFFTFLGYADFYFLIMPAIYWCWDAALGLRLGVFLSLNNVFVGWFKVLFHAPRPYWVDPRVRLWASGETSFGIPSGHAQNAVVVWGTLAAYLRRGWGWAVAGLVVLFIGVSRVYLGVHFPTDVFAGWVLGLLFLGLFLTLEGRVTTWIRKKGTGAQILTVFALSLVMILIFAWMRSGIQAGWQLPEIWQKNAGVASPDAPIQPFSLEGAIVAASAFFGLVTGAILLDRRGGFDARGPWVKRIGRFLIGLIGVLLIWRGLAVGFSLLAEEHSLMGYVLRYLRYALVGGWISGLGPWFFLKLNLARPALKKPLKPV